MSIRIDADLKHTAMTTFAARDFLAFAELALAGVQWEGLEAVAWDTERQCARAIYRPPADDDAAYIAEAIARMIAVRSRRRDFKTGQLRPAIREWWPLVKLNFAPLFDGCWAQEVGTGWLDLTLALADWLWTPDSTLRFDHFAAGDDGELRVDMQGYDHIDQARVTAFEMLSRHVCVACGAPGRVYERNSLFAAVVACPAHAPPGDDDE